MAAYIDYFKCPKCGHENKLARRDTSIGKKVKSCCWKCQKYSMVIAGEPPDGCKCGIGSGAIWCPTHGVVTGGPVK